MSKRVIILVRDDENNLDKIVATYDGEFEFQDVGALTHDWSRDDKISIRRLFFNLIEKMYE